MSITHEGSLGNEKAIKTVGQAGFFMLSHEIIHASSGEAILLS